MKLLLTSLFCALLFVSSIGQDMIVTKSGKIISCKLLDQEGSQIQYQTNLNNRDTILHIYQSQILGLKYQKGRKYFVLTNDIRLKANKEMWDSLTFDDFTQFSNGVNDASIYYHGYREKGTGVFAISTLFTPIGGLLPASIYALYKPKEYELNIPRETYTELYKLGYTQAASKIHRSKMWSNYTIGSVISLPLYGLLFMLLLSQATYAPSPELNLF